MVRHKKSKKSKKDFKWRKSNHDNSDGLKINRSQEACREISRRSYKISMFEADNIVMYIDSGSRILVSVNKQVRKFNGRKCNRINGYNGNLNGDKDG